MSTASPRTIGRYQIIREIARSNDIVYEGYDPVMNRRVAIKELVYPTTGTDKQREERRRRFYREAKAAGSLSHPNIVVIYEAGEDAGRHYIAMEYLEGRNLRELLDAEGALSPEEAVPIMLQVLDALAYAHQHGVIHRDIKPENIQILADGRIKLTDFGIARLTFEQSITVDGQVFGTPSYMSPEQVVGKDLDARTDLFSCGVVLYEMLTGAKPFTGDSVVTITYAICHTEPVPPPGVPEPLVAVIRKAMQKPLVMRYGSASEMAAALKEAMEELRQPRLPSNPPWLPSQGVHPQGVPASVVPGTVQSPPAPTQQAPLPIAGSFPPGWAEPPPPPLLSPRAKQVIGAALLTFLIGAAVVGLVFAGFYGLQQWYEARLAEAHDQRLRERLVAAEQLARHDPSAAWGAMSELERMAETPHFVQSVRKSRAVVAEIMGKRLLHSGDFIGALEWFSQAASDDPSNPAYHTDIGRTYELIARSAADALSKREALMAAAEAWQRAATLYEANKQPDLARVFYQHSAELVLIVGTSFEQDGAIQEAARAYRLAYELAPFESPVRHRAESALDRILRGGLHR